MLKKLENRLKPIFEKIRGQMDWGDALTSFLQNHGNLAHALIDLGPNIFTNILLGFSKEMVSQEINKYSAESMALLPLTGAAKKDYLAKQDKINNPSTPTSVLSGRSPEAAISEQVDLMFDEAKNVFLSTPLTTTWFDDPKIAFTHFQGQFPEQPTEYNITLTRQKSDILEIPYHRLTLEPRRTSRDYPPYIIFGTTPPDLKAVVRAIRDSASLQPESKTVLHANTWELRKTGDSSQLTRKFQASDTPDFAQKILSGDLKIGPEPFTKQYNELKKAEFTFEQITIDAQEKAGQPTKQAISFMFKFSTDGQKFRFGQYVCTATISQSGRDEPLLNFELNPSDSDEFPRLANELREYLASHNISYGLITRKKPMF